jgi:hypothetical protein
MLFLKLLLSLGSNALDLSYAKDSINLENKLFPALCSIKKFYVFKTENLWSPIKSAG